MDTKGWLLYISYTYIHNVCVTTKQHTHTHASGSENNMSYVPLLGQNPPLSYAGPRKPPLQPLLVGAEPVFASPSYPTLPVTAAPTVASAMSSSVRAIIIASMLCTVVAVVIAAVSLGILLPFRDETNARFGALENTTPATTTATSATTTTTTTTTSAPATTAPSGSGGVDENTTAINVGTLGVGVFRDEIGDVLNFRNVAPGTYTTVVLDANDNIVIDVNATELATPNTIVLRNASAGFAAGSITMDGFGPTDGQSSVLAGGGTLQTYTGDVYLSVQAGYYTESLLYVWNYYTDVLSMIGTTGSNGYIQLFFDNNSTLWSRRDYTLRYLTVIDKTTGTPGYTSPCDTQVYLGGYAFSDDNVNVYTLYESSPGSTAYDLVTFNVQTCAIAVIAPQIFIGATMATYNAFSLVNRLFIDMFRQNGKLYITIPDYLYPPALTRNVVRPSLLITYDFATTLVTSKWSNVGVVNVASNPSWISTTSFCTPNGPAALQMTTAYEYAAGASINSRICTLDPETGLTHSCRQVPIPGNGVGNVNQVFGLASECRAFVPPPVSLKLQGDIDANSQYSINNAKKISTQFLTAAAVGTSSLQTLNGTDLRLFAKSLIITNGTYGGLLQLGADTSLYRSSARAIQTDSLLTVSRYNAVKTDSPALNVYSYWNLTGTNMDNPRGLVASNRFGPLVSNKGILTFSIVNPGTGYTVGNIVILTSGGWSPAHRGRFTVTSTTIDGNVTTLSIQRPGSFHSTGIDTPTGGSGTGLQVNLLTLGASTATTLAGIRAQAFDLSGGSFASPLITNAAALYIAGSDFGNGPLTVTSYAGIDVPNSMVGGMITNCYGIRLATPNQGTVINNALNFVASTTQAGGITYGTDVTTYRSAAGSVTHAGLLNSTTAFAGGVAFTGTNIITASSGSTGGLLTFSVNVAGTGYVVGNLLAVTGGNGNARLTVTTIDGTGGVLTFSLTRPGAGYSVASGVATTLGAGTGATVNILSIGTSTYASTVGVQAQGITATGMFSTSTVTTATAFQVLNNVVGSGPIVIGTQLGLDVPTLTTASTNAYGIRVAAPTGGSSVNNALNFVASTAAAGGITFGTDANLYRSAVGMLKTDTDLTVRTLVANTVSITNTLTINSATCTSQLPVSCIGTPATPVVAKFFYALQASTTTYGVGVTIAVDRVMVALSNFMYAGGVFTCQVAGTYLISAHIATTGSSPTFIMINNGTDVRLVRMVNDPNSSASATVHYTLAVGNTIRLVSAGGGEYYGWAYDNSPSTYLAAIIIN